MRAIGAAVGIFNSRCLEKAFYASIKEIFTILLKFYHRCWIMQHACGDFQHIRPIRQLRLKMRKRGLPDISTFDPVDRRRLLRFHTAQNSAPSGSNPIAGPVLKKGPCRSKALEVFIVYHGDGARPANRLKQLHLFQPK